RAGRVRLPPRRRGVQAHLRERAARAGAGAAPGDGGSAGGTVRRRRARAGARRGQGGPPGGRDRVAAAPPSCCIAAWLSAEGVAWRREGAPEGGDRWRGGEIRG